MTTTIKTLVMGIGNLLLCDEGVGVHAARALQQEQLPPNVVAIDTGTAFLDSLPEIERADRIIIVDAMKAGKAPGSIYRVPFEDCARPECIASLHGFDMSRVLYMSGRQTAPEVIVIGAEPARIEWGTELSPDLQAALPRLLDVIRKEIAG